MNPILRLLTSVASAACYVARRSIRNSFFVACLSLVPCLGARATTWDAVADFSWSSNPNGPWVYGYKPSLGSTAFYVCERLQVGYGWYHFAWTAAPMIGKDFGNFMPGFLMFHPAGYQEGPGYSSCLRWTAPADGVYRIDSHFDSAGNWGQMGQNVLLALNGVALCQDSLLVLGDQRRYTNVVSLRAGDTVDTVVGNLPSVLDSQVGVKVTISTFVPPPPRLTVRASQVDLCWNTDPNAWYQLQYRSPQTSYQWVPLTTNWVRGNGSTFCTNDVIIPGQEQRFYQVVATNAPPQP